MCINQFFRMPKPGPWRALCVPLALGGLRYPYTRYPPPPYAALFGLGWAVFAPDWARSASAPLRPWPAMRRVPFSKLSRKGDETFSKIPRTLSSRFVLVHHSHTTKIIRWNTWPVSNRGNKWGSITSNIFRLQL